jgi:hypothetical protein
VLGVLAAPAVWGVSEPVFGIDVRQPAFGTGVPQDLTAGSIIVASVVAWLALAVPERLLLGRVATVGADRAPHVAPIGWAHDAAQPSSSRISLASARGGRAPSKFAAWPRPSVPQRR